MTKSFLNSTTAVVASLALVIPLPATAQTASATGDMALKPCIDAEGVVWEGTPERGGKDNKRKNKEAKEKDKNPAVGLTGEVGQCAISDGEQQLVVAGIVTDTGDVYASFRQVMVAAKAEPEAEVTAEAEAAAAEAEAAAEAQTAAEDEAAAEAQAAAEAEAQAAAEAEALAAAEAEAAAEAQTAAEDEAAAEAQAAAEAEAVGETEPETEAASEVEAAAEAEAEADVTAEGSGTEQVEAAQSEVQQEDTVESTAAANEVVETQAATEADVTTEAEVETTTVTEADTRSSSEDFSTSAAAQAAPDDKGLSDFEKFALGALGVVAVGTLLNNGDKVVSNSGDRVVVQRSDGEYQVLKDDNVLLRQPGVEIQTERFSDGSTRETVFREDGTQVVTIKAANGQVLRRVRVLEDGTQFLLFDDTAVAEPVAVTELPEPRQSTIALDEISADDLRIALAAQEAAPFDRRFSLQQIRQIRAVRELVPVIELDAVNFDTGSAAIRASEAEELRDLGVVMRRLIDENPYEVFLVEGHTDAVGNATYNLALSDRRAESVALALTEYFDVPPENMVVQGYGESNLKIRTPLSERENRRATVRRITDLLQTASMQ